MANITVIMPTSPNAGHPSTAVTEETIDSVRHHLPDAEIILTFDGVRAEQEHYRKAYMQYVDKMMWRALHHYTNVLPMVFDKHMHQSGMLKASLPEVKTDMVMYVEHDTPLRTDRTIPFGRIEQFITSGKAYTVRLHHEEVLPLEHRRLFFDKGDMQMRKTYQWSQRPHVSSTVYYKQIADSMPEEWRTMIEDYWHGIVDNDYKQFGKMGWYKHRLWCYLPPNGLQRSYHLDARGSDPKYEMEMGEK